MRKVMFWLFAALTAASGVYGLITNPTLDFILSWSCGVVCVAIAMAFKLSELLNKKK